MVQIFLAMMARANPLISILERGDSYRPLVELMGGRVIEVDLEGAETLNLWDLPAGQISPSKEKIAFLKNLTLHMIGDSPGSDRTLLDNLLSDAIARTYKRCAIRYSKPIPTFNDLREELANWRDEERLERTIDEAKLAAIKLRLWTGEKGIYSKLFDSPSTMRLNSNWLFFDIEGLKSDPTLETAMSMVIANAVADRASPRTRWRVTQTKASGVGNCIRQLDFGEAHKKVTSYKQKKYAAVEFPGALRSLSSMLIRSRGGTSRRGAVTQLRPVSVC